MKGTIKRVKPSETKFEQILRCPSNKSKNESQLEKENKEKVKKYQ